MAIGIGVHVEQGLEETPIRDAQALAELLCTALLAEKAFGRFAICCCHPEWTGCHEI